MSYQVRMTPAAEKDLKGLPKAVRVQVAKQLRRLAEDPRPPGAAPVKNRLQGDYRVRVGNYRVGYEVDDQQQTVTVWQIGDRKRFYDRARRRR